MISTILVIYFRKLKKSVNAEDDQSKTDNIIPTINTKHKRENPIIKPVSIIEPALLFSNILIIIDFFFFFEYETISYKKLHLNLKITIKSRIMFQGYQKVWFFNINLTNFLCYD